VLGPRAAVLALVVCGLLLSAALPLREHLAQRDEIAQLEGEQQQARMRVAALEAERDRLQDPAYVAAEARRRLHFVLPGETAYVVLVPEETEPKADAEAPVGSDAPWYSQVWGSVEQADRLAPPPS
jgi:cell division protein FtsB